MISMGLTPKLQLLLSLFLVLGVFSASGATGPAQWLESLPAWFEPNQGLAAPEVKYFSRGGGYTLQLRESGAELSLVDGSHAAKVRLELKGGSRTPAIEPLELQRAHTNYLIGNQRNRWKTNVPQYGRVRYRGAYPGIDLVYYGTGGRLEYDFVIAPGADPGRIRIRFNGADSVRLAEDGSLAIALGQRKILQPKPTVYQDTPAGRRHVDANYVLASSGEVRFRLGNYDRRAPLVIDPVLVYAGYFGGSVYDAPTGVAVDPDGSIWLTGTTFSQFELPVQNEPYRGTVGPKYDAFIAKMTAPTSGPPTLLYFTYLGGTDFEYGGQILVGPDGMVYVTGMTTSADFPVTSNAFSKKLGGANNKGDVFNQDAFIAKINPAAAAAADSLVFSSFIGGSKLDAPTALYLAPNGTLLVAGFGASDDIDPITQPTVQPNNRGGTDGWVYKIDPNGADGATNLYSSYFGGNSTDVATGVGSDASGAIYLTGYTFSSDLPIAGNAYQATLDGFGRNFLAKFDLTKTGLDALVYGSYFGGGLLDVAQAMKMDAAGGIWIAGYTMSSDFPVTPNAFRTTYPGGASDIFLSRLDLSLPPEQALTYSTYFGGSGADVCYGILLLGGGKVALTGYTVSNDLPLMGAPGFGQARSLMADAFVAILDTNVPGVGALTFGTYFGGSNNDVGLAMATDAAGNLYATGYSQSGDLPVTDGSTKQSPFGSTSGFLLRMDKQPGE